MRSKKLNQTLAALASEEMSAESRSNPKSIQSLEAELLSRHRRLYPRKAGWKMLINPRWRTGRLVLAGVALLILGIGACTIPTEYEAEVGKALAIHVPQGASQLPEPSEMLAFLEGANLADEISVSISEQTTGEADIKLMLWNERVSEDELVQILRERYPVLQKALFEVHEMAGTVQGSLADKIGHDVFHIEVSGEDSEEIRHQVLEYLAAQGFNGDAMVEIYEEGDETLIDITIEGEQEP